MKLAKIKFDNYKNLSGVELSLDLTCNFLVGENSTGKSNALKCIQKIYKCENFAKEDFYDLSKPIVLQVEFYTKESYNNYKGKKISVSIEQDYLGEIKYSSQDIFIKDLKKELKLLYLTNKTDLESFIALPNLSKKFIELFNDLNIVKRAKKHSGLNKNIDLNNINSSQEKFIYSKFFILDVLLSLIKFLSEQKEENLEGVIIYSAPEQNLYPFAQKTLVKDLIDLASGQDEGFNRFIDQHFGIKKISLQLIFKSHSDRILLNDYTKIIRFYRQGEKINVVCGQSVSKRIKNDINMQKQLDMQFPYFSLAIFSRCVILVEGVSESGALEEFAKKMEIDLDYLGISIISANGEGNVPSISELLKCFGISVVTVRDRDCTSRQSLGDNFFTDGVDFEDEIVSCATKEQILQIFETANIEYKKADFSMGHLQRKNLRYGVTNRKITKGVTFKDFNKGETFRRLFCLSLLSANKSVIMGKVIGKILQKEQIPSVYKRVLLLAKEYAEK